MCVERLYGIVVFLIGTAIFWQGRSLNVGDLHAPGPGFFPAMVSIVMMGLSLFLIISPSKDHQEEETVSLSKTIQVFIIFVLLVVYALTVEFLGFFIVSFLMMLYLFKVVGNKKLFIAILGAFISVGIVYLLFQIFLDANLPKGVFGV